MDSRRISKPIHFVQELVLFFLEELVGAGMQLDPHAFQRSRFLNVGALGMSRFDPVQVAIHCFGHLVNQGKIVLFIIVDR